MKKMLLATALALLITGCAQQTFTVQNKPAMAPKETITHHFFVSGIGRRKLSMQPKFVAKAGNVKTKQQTFVNGLLGFITLSIYTPARKRVCIAHNNCMSCPASIWATLSALLINILLGSFQLFLHSDQPLSEGEIKSRSAVSASRGRLHYPRRRRWWLHALTDELLMCNRRRPAATSSRRASFPALASANSFVYFASSAATSR